MRLIIALSFSLTLNPFISCSQSTPSIFEPLFDGQSLEGWHIENSTLDNFYVLENNLRVEGPEGWLRSEQRYSDFILKAELRFLTDDADSGIFIRVSGDTPFIRGWPGNSYQIQTRDISSNQTNNPILLGNIYRHRIEDGETQFDRERLFEVFTGTGEWQNLEIEAVSDSILVRLNGTLITRGRNVVNPDGYIGIQGETGIVEFKSIEIREL